MGRKAEKFLASKPKEWQKRHSAKEREHKINVLKMKLELARLQASRIPELEKKLEELLLGKGRA